MKTIIIVCGERDWKDKATIWRVLDAALDVHRYDYKHPDGTLPPDEHERQCCADFILRHGICEGADIVANEWGLARGVTVERFRAEWRDHTGYHPEAGPIRNRAMAKAEPRAKECLAFWSGKMRIRNGKHEYSGTLDMMKAALGEGIPVRITPPRKEPTT